MNIGNDSYLDGDLELEGQVKSLLADGGLPPWVGASKELNLNWNSNFLGGYDAIKFPRKAENAVIAGDWDFTNAPDIVNWNTNPNSAVAYGQLSLFGAGYVPVARQIIAGTGLSGGGALSADRTLSLNLTYTDGRYGQTLTPGTGIIGSAYNGSGAQTWSVNLATANYWTKTGSDLSYSAGNVGIGGSPISPLHVYYPYAKTDTTDRGVVRLSSNDTNPTTLYISSVGGASQSVRQFSMQTYENGVGPGGALKFQYFAGDLYLGNGTGLIKTSTGLVSYITDNSSNWNTAYGWGNHAGLYALVGRAIAAGTGLTGGGTLSADRTISLDLTYADARYSLAVHYHTFASLTSKPTTISGYGITDVLSQALTGYITGSNSVLTSSNTILTGFQNLQAQISTINTVGTYVRVNTGDYITGDHVFAGAISLPQEYYHIPDYTNTVNVRYGSTYNPGPTSVNLSVWDGVGWISLYFDGAGNFSWNGTLFATTSFVGSYFASNSVQLTVQGTSGRITSSAGAQSLAANRTWTLDLATAGTAGTYRSVTTDAYGRVTAGTNPTTISGYGITDLLSQVLTGYTVGSNTALTASDTLLTAFRNLQAQISAIGTGLSGYVATSRTLTINGTAYDLSANRSWAVGTVTSVALSAPTGLSVSGSPVTSTGTLTLGFTAGYSLPSDATQATWTAKQAALSGTGLVKSTSGTISYITDNSSNWNTAFSSSHAAVTIGTANGLSLSTQALSLQLATGSVPGALSAADWTTFNGKQASITATTTADYYRGDKSFQTLNTLAVPELTNLYFTAARVLATVLTGYTAGTNTVLTASHTVLNAFRDVQAQISSLGTSSHAAVTIGTANGLSLSTQALSLALSSTSTTGALSSTNWNTFNGKMGGSGTSTVIPVFSAGTTLADSLISQNSSTLTVTIATAGIQSKSLYLPNYYNFYALKIGTAYDSYATAEAAILIGGGNGSGKFSGNYGQMMFFSSYSSGPSGGFAFYPYHGSTQAALRISASGDTYVLGTEFKWNGNTLLTGDGITYRYSKYSSTSTLTTGLINEVSGIVYVGYATITTVTFTLNNYYDFYRLNLKTQVDSYSENASAIMTTSGNGSGDFANYGRLLFFDNNNGGQGGMAFFVGSRASTAALRINSDKSVDFTAGIRLNNSFGSAGQVLTSSGGSVNTWTTPSSTDTWQDVLSRGSIATTRPNIKLGTWATGLEYLRLEPTDYGTNKPYFTIANETSGSQWNLYAFDGSTFGTVNVVGTLKVNGVSVVTASSTDSFTNKSGNISQWTNDSNYATQSYVGSQGFITASSSDTLTNKSGNISQWSNDSNYATQSYVGSQGFITASSSDTLTNKSGNISQWSNDSNYATQSYVTSQGYISSAYVYGQTSLTGGGNAGSGTQYINLVNDSGSPGNNMLYGTNGSGTKGWYAQPSGGGGVSGSGTSGYFPIWNGSGSQTNSIIDMVSIALVRINGRLTLTDYLFPVQVTASTRAGMSVVVGGIVYQTDGGSAEGLWQYRSSGWVQL